MIEAKPIRRTRAKRLGATLLLLAAPSACGREGATSTSTQPSTASSTQPSTASSTQPSASTSNPPTPTFPATVLWPMPSGSRLEVIPFPLDFAPDLSYRGDEVIHFAPHFFDASAPTYFSYAFAWVLSGQPSLDVRELEHGLTRYFAGLCNAVGEGKRAFDESHFRAALVPLSPSASSSANPVSGSWKSGNSTSAHSTSVNPTSAGSEIRARDPSTGISLRGAFQGTVDTYDPFGDGRALTLRLAVRIFDCEHSGSRVAAFIAAPNTASAAVWQQLSDDVAKLTCAAN